MKSEATKVRLPQSGPRKLAAADDACLHELFEGQVEASPAAEALAGGGRRFSYAEVNRRANRLAARLRSLGVGPETIVGILMDRSAEMVFALLGVLKAGGAYLPLDPAYPRERLAFMLEDSRAVALLSQPSLAGLRAGLVPSRLPVIDVEPGDGAESDAGVAPGPSPRAHNLAYVIYTSGSTGKPKAVAVEHRNAVALVEWADQVYGAGELSGVLAGVSICFDPSILDLFMPLCLGGKVILAANTLALPGLAEAEEVRLVFSVPSVVRELLRVGGLPRSLETINLGGEPLSAQLVEQIYALPHVRRVYDLYGPTETATCSTFALRVPGKLATIGRPIARTEVHLLDDALQPVSSGATGELFIGGAGVTRGYLHRPELTAERFLRLDLPGGSKVRVYRTGDLCRTGPDGELVFMGRKDQQVKIRGFRVELGEIEAALLAHPAVEQGVVVAHEETGGDRRLVAYVSPRRTTAPASADLIPHLRTHLQSRLPDYMVPGTFVLVERFELTESGKIDREALPAPARNREGEGEFQAPRTPVQEMLSGIWAGLLGLGQIGIDDDFFHLGGDSLLFTVMLAQVQENTGVKLPLEAIQQARSIRRFAVYVEKKSAGRRPAAESTFLPIQSQGNRAPLFLVHGLGGSMLWGYGSLARHLGADQPVYALQDPRGANSADFDTIPKIAAHYVGELRRFQPQGPYALGGFCFGGIVAYEMACQLVEQGQPVSLVVLLDSAPPDSSYHRFRWSAAKLGVYLRNFGYWLQEFRQWDAARRRKFLRWKWPSLRQRARRLLRPAAARSTPAPLEERIDLSGVPLAERPRWELHLRAQERHRTRPYGGRVLLIRSRYHPMTSSYDGEHGWGEFVQSRLAVRVVPGLHEKLLEEPSVAAVARELTAFLDAAQPTPAPGPARASAHETALASAG